MHQIDDAAGMNFVGGLIVDAKQNASSVG
jgi:hypothetical protein